MSFEFNKHGVCINPETVHALDINGLSAVLQGAEQNGLWDVAADLNFQGGRSARGVHLSKCTRTKPQAVYDACGDLLETLEYWKRQGHKVPPTAIETVKRWRYESRQLSLF